MSKFDLFSEVSVIGKIALYCLKMACLNDFKARGDENGARK